MTRKKSVATALASIGRVAKQNLQLTPKSKPKKVGRHAHRRKCSLDESLSSSSLSFDENSYSDISESDFSSSNSEESITEQHSRSRKGKSSRLHRSRGDKRNFNHRDRRRARTRDRDRYSSDSYGEYTPQRHLKNPNVVEDDASQMIHLLMRILPFYGKGDRNSDAVVIDTIHRLPPHALEMQDLDGNTLLMVACQAAAFNLMPILLSKGCNVNTRNNVGASCLHFACFADTFSPDSATSLLRHGALAEVAENEFGCTPLHWAAFSGHVELCTALCRAGGSPTTKDKNGCDPIHYSKQNGHTACAQLLSSFLGNTPGPATSNATGTSNTTTSDAPSDKSGWVRCLDSSTGSSFYHNKETGESLWGDDFRKVDQVGEPPVADIKTSEEEDASSPKRIDKVSEKIPQVAPEAKSTKESPTPEKINQDPFKHTPITGTFDAPPLTDAAAKISEKQLAAIVEDLDETLTIDNVEQKLDTRGQVLLHDIPGELFPEKETKLADIDDIVDTLSIEDVEPTQARTKLEAGCGKGEVDSGDSADKKLILSRLNSRDAEFYVETEKENLCSKPRKQLSVETAQVDDKVVQETGAAVSNEVVDPNVTAPCSSTNYLAKNQSFEERISSLHQKMQYQLMHRLQHLEDKITQQNCETSVKVEDDASNLKENVAEMASTILQLRTEVGTKDLEILSLKQQIITIETASMSKLKQSINIGLGDGCLRDNNARKENGELLAAKARYEQELADAHNENAQLKEQVVKTTKSINASNERYEQTQPHPEVAEQLALDEKASRSDMINSLEQFQKEEVYSALSQEEEYCAEKSVMQLMKQIKAIEDTLVEERDDHLQELEKEKTRSTKLENEMKKTEATHNASLLQLKGLHSAELSQVKEELNCVRSELGSVQEQLKSATMERMEIMVAKDEAVVAMEKAFEKACSAEAKVQEMTDLVKKTDDLMKLNERLHFCLQDETEKRKELHNTLEDMKGRIRVYVRVRPLSKTEVKAGYVNVMTKEDCRTCVMAGDAATSVGVRDWEFDKIFYGSDNDGNTQENVFEDTSLLLTSAIDGFNVCIFAYGQTGSGKTYTMLGSADGDAENQRGLAPRVAHELFRKLAERESSHHIEVTTSMLELYTDKLRDLLVASKSESERLGDLKIRLAEHTSSGLVEVDGAKIERVTNAEELLGVFDRGTHGRASSSTKMNADSSRSHMIATIVLVLRNRRTGKIINGKLTLVDLAGSERVSKSGATGYQLKEAQSINKSLSALGGVIGALTSSGRQHIPYRNHPLTMLMSDSIGGNAKTLMFVCCSPADYNRKETANSLDFAKRCRNVMNNAVSKKDASGSSASHVSQIRALRAELSKIKERERGTGAAKRRPVGMRRPGM